MCGRTTCPDCGTDKETISEAVYYEIVEMTSQSQALEAEMCFPCIKEVKRKTEIDHIEHQLQNMES